MRDQEFTDLQEAYARIWEQQVGVPIPSGETAENVLKKMIPKGEKVLRPKSSKLQNAHYELEGELVSEERPARKRKGGKSYEEIKSEIDSKNKTEPGITGLSVPKKNRSPRKQHEFEKKRRAARGNDFSQYRMTGSRGHGSEYSVNPRISYRHNEEYLIDYLLGEGFAFNEKSAQAIYSAMSEEWKQSIVEAEVLAMRGGVPGSVKVRPALSIPGTNIGIGPNRPVPGTFTTTTPEQRKRIESGDRTIDRGTYQQSRVGAGPTSPERQRYNAELIRQGKHTAPRMPR